MNPLSLFNIFEKFLNHSDNEISANQDYCVRLKSPMASCYECIERCPELSINISGAGVEILNTCTHCNACVYICPNYVFDIKGRNNNEPKKRFKINDNVYYFCSRTNAETIDDKIECVYEVDILDTITHLKEGNNLFFITEDCKSCRYRYFHSKTMKRVKETVKFLNMEENFKEININEFDTDLFTESLKKSCNEKTDGLNTEDSDNDNNAEDKNFGRRDFFKNYLKGIKSNAKTFARDVSIEDLPFAEIYSNYIDSGDKEDKKHNRLLIEKRRDMFLFLKNNKDLISLLNIKLPKLNKSCVFCGNCWELCPTGALSYKKNKILLEPFLCTGCYLCKDICSFGSVRMYKAKHLSEISKARVLLSDDSQE